MVELDENLYVCIVVFNLFYMLFLFGYFICLWMGGEREGTGYLLIFLCIYIFFKIMVDF